MSDEVIPWLMGAENSGPSATPVDLPGGYTLRKDQVYVCQPDGLIISDGGAAARIERPVSVRSERRWLAAVSLRPQAQRANPYSVSRSSGAN